MQAMLKFRVMNRCYLSFTSTLLVISQLLFSQDPASKKISENPELVAFDFLLGKWVTYEKSITNKDTTIYGPSKITVAKSNDGFSLLEDWEIKNRDTLIFKAVLHRIYDAIAKKWILSYSDSDLNYQVWEGRKENSIWYFYRERYRDGKKIIVKQKWVQLSNGKVNQVIERSFDEGKTWVTGSIIEYTKAK